MPAIPLPCRLGSALMRLMLASILLGLSFSAMGHVGMHEEIETLSGLIQKTETNSQLYLSRAEAYRLHGDQGSAIADFNKVLDTHPGHAAAATGLGRTYLEGGDPWQAIVHLNRALIREPGNVRALSLRARANAQTGRPLKAAEDYTRAIEQFGEQRKPLPDYYLERARAFAAAGDDYIDRALQGLDESITVLGNIRTLELYAVEIETQRGDYDAALSRLDSVLVRAPRKEFLLFQRGNILAEAGHSQAAIEDFRAARAAIENLPPQRRYTQSVSELQAQLDVRLAAHGHRSGDE